MFLPQAQPLTFVRPWGQLEWNPGLWVVGATLFRYVCERKTWTEFSLVCSALHFSPALSSFLIHCFPYRPVPYRPVSYRPIPVCLFPFLSRFFTSRLPSFHTFLTVPSLSVPFFYLLISFRLVPYRPVLSSLVPFLPLPSCPLESRFLPSYPFPSRPFTSRPDLFFAFSSLTIPFCPFK